MYREDAPPEFERTAFRNAEKKYKLYKPPSDKSRKKNQAQKETDLSGVFDFLSVSKSFELTGETPPGIFKLDSPGFHRPVFCFDGRPGFYFIPSALTVEEQCHWIKESLTSFPQPPNRTNHSAAYGPIYDLFDSAKKHKVLIEADSDEVELVADSCERKPQCRQYSFSEERIGISDAVSGKSIPASTLLRKLRWSTLGLQFNWSKRNYDLSLPHNKIPDSLCRLSRSLAVPAMPPGQEFQPEAAIVNYFGQSDMLGGHLDDMEADWSKPIVSISLGCKAVFLIGGKTREDPPIAMFLRSGDVVLMAGQARECFHGIPRIFTEHESEISDLLEHFLGENDQCFAEYVKSSRININIRQVY